MGKKGTSDKKKAKADVHFSIVEYIFLLIVCALVFIPPFFRGLFFERELIIVHIISFLLALVWFWIKQRRGGITLFRFRHEYLLLGLVAAYFVTIPIAASSRAALMEAVKYANYFVLYLMARDHVICSKKNAYIISGTIIFSVFLMCIVGLANYLGFMNNTGALTGGRISSTLQYPNTLAAVIGASMFLILPLIMNQDVRVKAVYSFVLSIMTVTFILTFSRAMWIILPLMIIAFIGTVKPSGRLEATFHMLACAVPAVIASAVLPGYYQQKDFSSIAVILVSALVSIAAVVFISRFRFGTLSSRTFIAIVCLAAVLAGAGGAVVLGATRPVVLSHYGEEDGSQSVARNIYGIEGRGDYILKLDILSEKAEDRPWIGRVYIYSINKSWESRLIKQYLIKDEMEGVIEIPFSTLPDTYFTRIVFNNYYADTRFTVRQGEVLDSEGKRIIGKIKLEHKYLPASLSSRLESIHYKDRSVQGRLAFFRDAFSMIKRNFAVGLGGKGWQHAYMAFRSYEYWTTEPHSYPIQVWIETGTVGLLLFIGAICLYLHKAFRAYLDGEGNPLMLLGIIFFCLTLLAHSLIDFDLSLGAVSIMLWVCFAVTAAYLKTDISVSGKARTKSLYIKAVYNVFILILLLICISTALASQYTQKAVAASKGGSLQHVTELLTAATRLDPLNPDHRLNLAKVIDADDSIDVAEKYDRISSLLNKAIKRDRYNYKLYSEAAFYMYRFGRFDTALQYLDAAIACNPAISNMYMQKMDFLLGMSRYYHDKDQIEESRNMLKALRATESTIARANEILRRPVNIKPELIEYIYKAAFILDNIKDKKAFDLAKGVAMYESFDFDSNRDNMPDLWQIPYQEGKLVEGQIVLEKESPVFRVTSDNPSFYVQRPNITLEPSSTYSISVQARSASGTGKMTVYIGSSSGKAEQFREGNINLGGEYITYKAAFKTSDDINPGKQFVRLFFNDKEGEVYLKRIVITKLE